MIMGPLILHQLSLMPYLQDMEYPSISIPARQAEALGVAYHDCVGQAHHLSLQRLIHCVSHLASG